MRDEVNAQFAGQATGFRSCGNFLRAGGLGLRFRNNRLRFRRGSRRRCFDMRRLCLHRQNRLADLDGLPLGDQHLGDLSGVGTRDFHDGFVGFDFQHAVVGGDDVALANQYADHVAAGDVFTECGEFEIHVHVFLGGMGQRLAARTLVSTLK